MKVGKKKKKRKKDPSKSGWKPRFFINLAEFGPFFLIENPLYRLKSYFSGQNLGKFCPPKKNTAYYIFKN
jgi:hypothetical protein